MHSYDSLKVNHGRKVNQTIDSPILVFDYFQLGEIALAIAIILVFGIIFYSWGLMLFLLILNLGFAPVVKKKYPPGIFFHWPYKHLKMKLPGLINPNGNKKYSD